MAIGSSGRTPCAETARAAISSAAFAVWFCDRFAPAMLWQLKIGIGRLLQLPTAA
jgi:hypothetical protein